MNVLALVIAIVAVAVFVAAHFAVPRRWATIAAGLALLTVALIVQFVWHAHTLVVH